MGSIRASVRCRIQHNGALHNEWFKNHVQKLVALTKIKSKALVRLRSVCVNTLGITWTKVIVVFFTKP